MGATRTGTTWTNAAAKAAAVACAVASLTATRPASACGGFFCSASAPVNQAAERIIFAHDGEERVTQIVEILYDGPSEDFAWVLPVPGAPEVGVGSKQVFDRLQQATNPTYRFNDTTGGMCDFAGGDGGVLGAPSAAGGDLEGESGVQVIDAGAVGPYDYETISLDPELEDAAQTAVEWLTDNGYDIDEDGAETLRPYLANGLNLIAIRLQKGKATGAIRPLSLEYESAGLAIPIRPTAVAANDDMGVLVWVLGSDRAIPLNYRGLELNELLIDWFNPGTTYDRVVTAAADEAGGQGFVTEFSGPASNYVSVIDRGESTEPYLNDANQRDLGSTLQDLVFQLGAYDGFLDVAEEQLSLRAGWDTATFLADPYCYFNPQDCGSFPGEEPLPITSDDPIYSVNLESFAAAVESDVLDPIREAAALFEQHDQVTRLYTTMSAEEMTKDPTFDFNPDLEDVDNVHVAERRLTCDGPGGAWRVTLASGEVVYGEGRTWPHALETTELPLNLRVLQFSTAGLPTVVTDNRRTIQTIHDGSEASVETSAFREDGGCSVATPGRSSSGGVSWAWMLLAGGALAWWTRQRQPQLARIRRPARQANSGRRRPDSGACPD